MTPQVAAGVGLGGLAAAGAGGSAIAYAAGAFNKKDEVVTYANFEAYVRSKNWTYIGGLEDTANNSIKNLLDEDKTSQKNGYRDKLSAEWGKMKHSDLTGTVKPTKPSEEASALFKSSDAALDKSSDISAFVKAWCEVKKDKIPGNNEKWTEDTLTADEDWKVFEEVCLIK
ncbi:hypothetical protein [Candidatus Mycoplasma haematohominis]|uniref:Uncharacterized protein n=1 Tax=Candidatus Mycoplasma haematohominis TaxID=1494318 RepID=A0A478FP39_9MOLU|nr:hypothetical protein [Candidatus Mycoplasma haemohominis]GCE63078.1 hypothetical protein MHSWG343_00560 [Candidatus Mycoplasma haemohominis]